ncbi:MAG: class II aldolase/adducin family protein [Methanobacteriaceae archaeon]|jgi:L-fuculose-phosphate aldolase|nr:class II aldolase/adducin family protein [Methanobacteriaceae archaeon]
MKNQAKEVVDISKYLYERKLVSGKAGNVSLRFKSENGDIIAITPTLKSLGNLEEKDIVLVDIDGNVLSKGNPSSELDMHLAIYKKRKDVNGIAHTHSPFATGFAFSEKRIKRHDRFGKISAPYLEDLEYEAPGSENLAKKACEALEEEETLVLKDHGIIAIGKNLEEAAELVEFVEDIAKTQFISYMLNLSDEL